MPPCCTHYHPKTGLISIFHLSCFSSFNVIFISWHIFLTLHFRGSFSAISASNFLIMTIRCHTLFADFEYLFDIILIFPCRSFVLIELSLFIILAVTVALIFLVLLTFTSPWLYFFLFSYHSLSYALFP
ncbi:hypothetical protein K435DRAFT_522932 [Dendrothele bispora CBS 962.96]|uniref:Uncharacterized protein n=1 Tax=Dendrothele bispora (strain CBS 962.96) TaxID=1314807 RepID=A0A4S8M8N2_DENBC|nr:hypothetical protein K435DRAFT_522932 [Dendrothele bispora CBS 962.96]